MTITTEEAERLAKQHDLVRFTLGMKAPKHDLTAATIRSLAAERDAMQARVAELEKALKINFHKHVQGASAADVVITRILPYSVSGVELKRLTEGKKDE
jgi:hypothetical protein